MLAVRCQQEQAVGVDVSWHRHLELATRLSILARRIAVAAALQWTHQGVVAPANSSLQLHVCGAQSQTFAQQGSASLRAT